MDDDLKAKYAGLVEFLNENRVTVAFHRTHLYLSSATDVRFAESDLSAEYDSLKRTWRIAPE